MTFPQLSSIAPLIGGQQFFRLKTQLENAGDIYESEVGALGFAMGPDSDLSNVLVSYFDPKTPGGVGQLLLSPDRNFAGRIDAHPGAAYIESDTRRGRILISTNDIYSPEWRPRDFDADVWNIIPPTLDVMQYFTGLPSVIPPRSDRTFRFEFYEVAAGGRSFLAIPSYGRKSGTIQVYNSDGGASVAFGVLAVRFVLSKTGGLYDAIEGVIHTPAALAQFAALTVPFDSTADGLWDYLILQIGEIANPYNGGAFPIVVTLSDEL